MKRFKVLILCVLVALATIIVSPAHAWADNGYAPGWYKAGGEWYYVGADGAPYRSRWLKFNGIWYYFGSDYKLLVADHWIHYDGSWYYRFSDGSYAVGWLRVDGTWRYFDSKARLVIDDWAPYGDTYYRMDAMGKVDASTYGVQAIKRSVKTPEGTVQGFFLYPKGLVSAPTIVYSHGVGGYMEVFSRNAAELAGKGIAVYIFDFIGGSVVSASGGNMLEMTVDTETSQLDAILNEVLTWKGVDPDRVYLAGQSQGALVSALIASSRDDVEAIILLAPALNLGEIVRATFGSLDDVPAAFDLFNQPYIEGLLGRAYAEALWDVYERDVLAGYEGRSLVIHGKQDEVIDPDVSVRAKKAWGSSCALVLLEDVDHMGVALPNEKVVAYISAFVL